LTLRPKRALDVIKQFWIELDVWSYGRRDNSAAVEKLIKVLKDIPEVHKCG